MDLMQIRRGLMSQMSDSNGIEVTITENVSNVQELVNQIINKLPTKKQNTVYMFCLQTPHGGAVNNLICGGHTYNVIDNVPGKNWNGYVIRFRNGEFGNAYVSIAYDAAVVIGDKYIVYEEPLVN